MNSRPPPPPPPQSNGNSSQQKPPQPPTNALSAATSNRIPPPPPSTVTMKSSFLPSTNQTVLDSTENISISKIGNQVQLKSPNDPKLQSADPRINAIKELSMDSSVPKSAITTNLTLSPEVNADSSPYSQSTPSKKDGALKSFGKFAIGLFKGKKSDTIQGGNSPIPQTEKTKPKAITSPKNDPAKSPQATQSSSLSIQQNQANVPKASQNPRLKIPRDNSSPRYCQLYNKEGDIFYLNIQNGSAYWILPNGMKDIYNILYVSHRREGKLILESVDTKALFSAIPKDFNPDVASMIPALFRSSRAEIEFLCNSPYNNKDSMRFIDQVDDFLDALDAGKLPMLGAPSSSSGQTAPSDIPVKSQQDTNESLKYQMQQLVKESSQLAVPSEIKPVVNDASSRDSIRGLMDSSRDDKVSALLGGTKVLQDQLNISNKNLLAAEIEISKLKEEISEMVSKTEASSPNDSVLKANIQLLFTKLVESDDDLQSKYGKNLGSLSELQMVANIDEIIQGIYAEVDDLQDSFDKANAKIKKLEEETVDTEGLVSANFHNREMDKLKAEFNVKSEELQKAFQINEENEIMIKSLQDYIANLEGEVETRDRTINDLQARIQQAQANNSKIMRDYEDKLLSYIHLDKHSYMMAQLEEKIYEHINEENKYKNMLLEQTQFLNSFVVSDENSNANNKTGKHGSHDNKMKTLNIVSYILQNPHGLKSLNVDEDTMSIPMEYTRQKINFSGSFQGTRYFGLELSLYDYCMRVCNIMSIALSPIAYDIRESIADDCGVPVSELFKIQKAGGAYNAVSKISLNKSSLSLTSNRGLASPMKREKLATKSSKGNLSLEDIMNALLVRNIEERLIDEKRRWHLLSDFVMKYGYESIEVFEGLASSLQDWYDTLQKHLVSFEFGLDDGRLSKLNGLFQVFIELLTPLSKPSPLKLSSAAHVSVKGGRDSLSHKVCECCIMELQHLHKQLIDHHDFKDDRMSRYGWKWESSISPDKKSTHLAYGLSPLDIEISKEKVLALSKSMINFQLSEMERLSLERSNKKIFTLSQLQSTSTSSNNQVDSLLALDPSFSTDNVLHLYNSTKAKLLAALSNTEMAITKLTIRFVGWYDALYKITSATNENYGNLLNGILQVLQYIEPNSSEEPIQHSTNLFLHHYRLSRCHTLLKKSYDNLVKLGVFSNISDMEPLLNPNISSIQAHEISTLYSDFQYLLSPFVEAYDVLMSINQRRNSITSTNIYRLTHPIDRCSIASLLVSSQSKYLVGVVFKHLPSLILPIILEDDIMKDSENETIVDEEACYVDLNPLDMTSAYSLRRFGFSCEELLRTKRFANIELLAAKYPYSDLMHLQFQVHELKEAGYSVSKCRAIGIDVGQLRAGGYSDIDIVKYGNFKNLELKLGGIDKTRLVLITFFNELGGLNKWKHRTNWCSYKPVKEWYGVTLNGHNEVIKIELRSNGLSGVIPDVISMLPSLECLDLQNNSLHGPLPPSLSKLRNLKDLWLSDNKFETPKVRIQLQAALPNCRIRI